MRVTIAPTVNNFIGAIKDTSLVRVVNLYDLTGALKLALSDRESRLHFVEKDLAVGGVHLVLGFALAGTAVSRRGATR